MKTKSGLSLQLQWEPSLFIPAQKSVQMGKVSSSNLQNRHYLRPCNIQQAKVVLHGYATSATHSRPRLCCTATLPLQHTAGHGCAVSATHSRPRLCCTATLPLQHTAGHACAVSATHSRPRLCCSATLPLQHTAGHGCAVSATHSRPRLCCLCNTQQTTVVLSLQHTAGHGCVARLRCL
jgi:hypothetical protein